jgi:hypothetical protein
MAVVALLSTTLRTRAARAEELEAENGMVEEVVQELFLGEAVYPQEQWELQATAAGGWVHETARDGLEAALELELGLTDRLQLAVEAPLAYRRDRFGHDAGLGNVALALMYNVANSRNDGLAMSLGLEAAAPSATDGVGEEAVLLEPFAIGYLALESLALNASLSVEIAVAPEGGETEVGGELTLAALLPRGDLAPTFEVGAGLEDGVAAFLFAPGLVAQLSENVEIGAATGGRFDANGGRALLVAVHLTWEQELAPDER